MDGIKYLPKNKRDNDTRQQSIEHLFDTNTHQTDVIEFENHTHRHTKQRMTRMDPMGA